MQGTVLATFLEPGFYPAGSWTVPARRPCPDLPFCVPFSQHRAPVGSALIGLCLAVAENKLIPLQLFMQRLSSHTPGPPAVPSTASPLLHEPWARGLGMWGGSWSSLPAPARGPRAGTRTHTLTGIHTGIHVHTPPCPCAQHTHSHTLLPDPLEAAAAGKKPQLGEAGGGLRPSGALCAAVKANFLTENPKV